MTRESGNYWCNNNGEWEVNKWSAEENEWYIPGDDNMYTDEHFEEIDENRIVRPNDMEQ